MEFYDKEQDKSEGPGAMAVLIVYGAICLVIGIIVWLIIK